VAEKDLATLLETLRVTQRPGRYCLVDMADVTAGATPQATIVEAEGTTAVVHSHEVIGDEPDFIAAWLTLEVNSHLAAVGLTAAVATCLALEGIACNVLAGRVHDHLLVPERDADRAIAAITSLSRDHS
jgi:hypothetical protein